MQGVVYGKSSNKRPEFIVFWRFKEGRLLEEDV